MSWLKRFLKIPKQDSNALFDAINNSIDGLGDKKKLQSILAHSNFTEAMPAFDADTLLEHHKNILDNLYDATGFDREAFDRLLLPLVRRFAEYVQMLPASEKHHHHSVGGLLEHSLEVCLIATRRAKGVSFCGHKEGTERELDKARWPISCAIAGLAHDLGKVAYDIIVRSPEGHSLWNPYVESLLEFGQREGGYRISWRSQRAHKLHEVAGLTLFNNLLTPTLKAWIAEGDREILPITLMAVAGYEHSEHPDVYQVVHESDKESVKKYMAKPLLGESAPTEVTIEKTKIITPNTALEPLYPPPEKPAMNNEPQSLLETEETAKSSVTSISNEGQQFDSGATKHLANMLPELLSSRRWVVNERDRERGFFWVDKNSAWVTWPALYTGINRAFEEEGFSSYPRHSGVFFDMLLSAGIVEKTAGEYTADVVIEQHTGKSLTLSMARLIDNSFIKLLQRYAENQVQLTANTALAESVKKNPSKFIAVDEGLPAETIELETIDLTSGLSKTLVNKTSFTAPKITQKKTTVSDYIRSLKNESIDWLREQGEAGECLEGICSAIARQKINVGDYGLLRGALWLKWPDTAKSLGDDDKQMLTSLMESNFLRRGNCNSFTVQPSGIARIVIKGTPLTVIAFDKNVTSKMKDAYLFDKDFRLDLGYATAEETESGTLFESQEKIITEPQEQNINNSPSKSTVQTIEPIEQKNTLKKQSKSTTTNKTTQNKTTNLNSKPKQEVTTNALLGKNQTKIKPTTQSNSTDKSAPTVNKKTVSNAEIASANFIEDAKNKKLLVQKKEEPKQFNLSEVFQLLDSFLIEFFSQYEGQVFAHEKGVAFNYFSIFYHDACTKFEDTLKTHWLGRLKGVDGVFTETMQIEHSTTLDVFVVPSQYMKKTHKLLHEKNRG